MAKMSKLPRFYQFLAVCLVFAMTWANARGYMVSSLFNNSDPAARSATGQISHK